MAVPRRHPEAPGSSHRFFAGSAGSSGPPRGGLHGVLVLPGLLLPQPECHTFEVLIIYLQITSDLFSKEKPDSEGSIRNEGSMWREYWTWSQEIRNLFNWLNYTTTDF